MLMWANAHLGWIALIVAAMIVASLLTERGHRRLRSAPMAPESDLS